MKRMYRSPLLRGLGLLAVVVALGAGSSGCAAEYDHTDITGFRASLFSSGEGVDRSHISVHSGMVGAFDFMQRRDCAQVSANRPQQI